LKTYIVKVYRQNLRKNTQKIVGVVEKVGVKGKKGFTNLEELWEILAPAESTPRQLKKDKIHSAINSGTERRDEVRIKKQIPFVFIYKKRNLNASTVNYSRNGLGVKIYEKVNLPVGDIMNLQLKDTSAKAEVKWVDKKSDPAITMAGFRIVEGGLDLN
jgi:hypothetical protein